MVSLYFMFVYFTLLDTITFNQFNTLGCMRRFLYVIPEGKRKYLPIKYIYIYIYIYIFI